MLSRLHTDTGDAVLFSLLVLTPGACPTPCCSPASYLLGPGFAVGTGTLVSPTVVAVGPVPMFPLLAALPDNGPPPAWTPALLALPVVLAALGGGPRAAPPPDHRLGPGRPARAGRRRARRGAFGVLAALAGGAVGPGRMADVGAGRRAVLVHAVVAFGVGGLLGGLLATWCQRRHA